MGFDEEYLDSLLKSIEPIINPDGVADDDVDLDAIPDVPEEELIDDVAEPADPDEEPEEVAGEIPVELPDVEEVTEEISVAEAVEEIPVAEAVEEIPGVEIGAAMELDPSEAEDILRDIDSVDAAELASSDSQAADATEQAAGEDFDPLSLLDYDPDDGGKILSADEISAMFNTVNSAMGDGPDKKDETSNSDEVAEAPEVQEIDLEGEEVDIDSLLNAAKESAQEPVVDVTGDDDLISLLASVGDEDLNDIQNILDSDANGEAVDADAFMAATNIDDVASNALETKEEAKARKKREKKEAKKNKKAPKVKPLAEGEEGGEEPKKGFFAKILDALTEPMDEDDFGIGDAVIEAAEELVIEGAEGENTGISDENKAILEQVDGEQGKKKGKKKKKKKKGKGEDAGAAGDEADSDGEEAPAEDKKKKKKKPKKEKAPKAEAVDDPYAKPEKRLPRKRVRAVVFLAISVIAAVLVLVFATLKITNLKEARWAFDNQDYQTAYEDLYGEELSGDDEIIFQKSQTILLLDRKYKSYQNYNKLGMRVDAVEALIEAVGMYPEVREKAEKLGVLPQVDYTYSLILSALDALGVSEDEAREISGYDSAVRYTKKLQSIANGTPYTYDDEVAAESAPVVVQPETKTVDDVLPEESDFLPDDPNSIFADISMDASQDDIQDDADSIDEVELN